LSYDGMLVALWPFAFIKCVYICMRSTKWCQFQWPWMTLTQILRARRSSTWNLRLASSKRSLLK